MRPGKILPATDAIGTSSGHLVEAVRNSSSRRVMAREAWSLGARSCSSDGSEVRRSELTWLVGLRNGRSFSYGEAHYSRNRRG